MKTLNKRIPIFGGQLTIIFDKSLESVEKKYNLATSSDYDALTFRTKNTNNRRIYVIAFENDAVKPSIIAHESLHIANMILDDIGHILDQDNDEVQAYLLEWIIKEVLKMVKKSKMKITMN